MSNLDMGDVAPVFEPKPDLPPPATTVGVIGWLRSNLFPDLLNSVLTLLGLSVAIWAIWTRSPRMK